MPEFYQTEFNTYTEVWAVAWVSAFTKLAGSKSLNHHAKAADFTIQYPSLVKFWAHRQ